MAGNLPTPAHSPPCHSPHVPIPWKDWCICLWAVVKCRGWRIAPQAALGGGGEGAFRSRRLSGWPQRPALHLNEDKGLTGSDSGWWGQQRRDRSVLPIAHLPPAGNNPDLGKDWVRHWILSVQTRLRAQNPSSLFFSPMANQGWGGTSAWQWLLGGRGRAPQALSRQFWEGNNNRRKNSLLRCGDCLQGNADEGKKRWRRDLVSFLVARVVSMATEQGEMSDWLRPSYGQLLKREGFASSSHGPCLLINSTSHPRLWHDLVYGFRWGRGHCYREVCGGRSGRGFILCLCKEQCELGVRDDGQQ